MKREMRGEWGMICVNGEMVKRKMKKHFSLLAIEFHTLYFINSPLYGDWYNIKNISNDTSNKGPIKVYLLGSRILSITCDKVIRVD